ncbi:MAG: hypothetical protein JRG91_20770 [Deltaproteobacteria bacterium]|nr:hypothetical protein [Deltaproteobacteria bacterium]
MNKIPAIILAVLAAALLSCQAPPFPQVDGGQSPPPPEPSPAAPTPAAPVVNAQAGTMTANIGDVQRGTWASHVFTIKNGLDKVMHVKNVRGS